MHFGFASCHNVGLIMGYLVFVEDLVHIVFAVLVHHHEAYSFDLRRGSCVSLAKRIVSVVG